jgi:signal peptide peptidase SppA
MRAIDALHAPWAILPNTLKAMIEAYERHASGEALDRKAIEAATGITLKNDPEPYYVEDGVAVLNVIGVLGKRFDMFTAICGGTSTQRLQDELRAALDDPEVESILLSVDSPGGEVDGTQALANDIFSARGEKPIVALIDGIGASAAYWIASAADRVYVSGDTTPVGSIGVVIAHTDVSKAQEMRGVKTTEITAGKYKRIASNLAPLSPEGRASLQEIADHIYGVFVDTVARNLGVSTDQVLADMADGRLFFGTKAQGAGLVHGVASMPEVMQQLKDSHTLLPESRRAFLMSGAKALTPTTSGAPTALRNEDKEMTTTILGAVCQDQAAVDAAVDAAVTKAKTDAHAEGVKAGHADGVKAGQTAERDRISAINKLSLAGHEGLITKAIEDGTPAADVAVAVVAAEQGKRAKVGADLVQDAPAPVPAAAAPAPGKPAEPDPSVVAEKAKQYQASQKTLGTTVNISDAVAHVRREMGLSK